MDQYDDGLTLLDYWAVVRKRFSGIAALVVFAVASALVVSLLLPKIYEGKASILAPKESGGGAGGALTAALVNAGGAQFLPGILPSGSNRDVFVSILKSDTMARELVEKFGLRQYYRTRYQSNAVKALERDTTISVSKEGAIGITTQHADPKTAADMANFYVENLDRLFAKLGTTDASRQRAFIQERLERTQADLRGAEDALKRFQETNKAVVLQEQSRAAVEAAARLKGEIAATEVQLQVLRTFATEQNPDVVRLERRVAEMKNQLGRMQYGTGLDLPGELDGAGRTRKEIFVPAVRIPQVGLELARLVREVKVQETVFTLLTSQLEQAKIAEARDTPMVQVLDRAVVADRKAKPKVSLNVALAGALSLLVGVFGAFFLESVETARRRRERFGSPDNGGSPVHARGEPKLPRPEAKPLAAPGSEEGMGEENEAVDMRQLKLPAGPAPEDGRRSGRGADDRPSQRDPKSEENR